MKLVPRFSRKIGIDLWLIGLAAAVMVLLWACGDRVTAVLQYKRSAIFNGEWWRLITGHVVHVDFRHTLLNVAGGLTMTGLFVHTYTRKQWLLILLVSLIAIDFGFLVCETSLETYVGFSGVLHGVLAAGTFAWWRTQPRGLAVALSIVTFGKLTWEQLQGPVSMASDTMNIIVNAHLYGAIGGGMVGAILLTMGKIPKPIAKRATGQPV